MTLRPNRIIADLSAHNRLPDAPIPMRDAVQIVETVKRLSGIHVDAGNSGFLRLRVNRRLRELGMATTDQYIARLNGLSGAEEAQHLVETLTTHTTDFFRERAHYDFMRSTGLPELMKLGAGKAWPLVTWSAACSIGSELWTAGIVMDQFSRSILGGLRWSLLGTDISSRVVARASKGVFVEQELGGLSEEMRRAYLLRSKPSLQAPGGGPVFRIGQELRSKAQFQLVNLVNMAPDFSTRADIAFLRNVLIYFKQSQKEAAVSNVLTHLRPGGYLFTGHAEAISPVPPGLQQVAPSVYRKAQDEPQSD